MLYNIPSSFLKMYQTKCYELTWSRDVPEHWTQLTVRELWVAELQVFARSGRVVLCPHRVFHAFNVLFKIVERAKDVFHALAVVHDGCIWLHVTGPLGLLGWLDGQWLNDLPWRTLHTEEEEKQRFVTQLNLQGQTYRCQHSQEVQEDQLNRCLLLDQQDPGRHHDYMNHVRSNK